MRVADFQQCGDVGFMWMRGKRVPQEDNCFDLIGGDQGSDLQVPAKRSGQHARDRQTCFGLYVRPSSICRKERLPSKQVAASLHKGDHVVLLRIVSDKGNVLHTAKFAVITLGSSVTLS